MNFKRIVSGSSLISSLPSSKDQCQTDEIAAFLNEVDNLKLMIEGLNISLESRDATIESIMREREHLYVQLKSAQRTNRHLQQQLAEERDNHVQEKQFLIEEIKRLSKDDHYEFNLNTMNRADKELSQSSLLEEIVEKNAIIFNLCDKYFRMRCSKTKLLNKYDKLLQKNHQVYEDIVGLLEENKECVNNLLQSLIQSSMITPSRKKYLTLLKFNAKLQYENTELKILVTSQDYIHEGQENITEEVPYKLGCSKSDYKTQIKKIPVKPRRRRPPHRNIYVYKTQSPLRLNRFGSIHSTFSPYAQNIYRTNSDPCIFQLTNK